MPKEIGKLKSLEILDLESNYLQELPSEIGTLRNLKELNLLDNKLSSLPSEIGSLLSLERLDLSFNTELRNLPPEFGNLVNLRELILSDNNFDKEYIDQFLLDISKFTDLRLLELINIGITALPSQFACLKKLQDLDLHYNQLSKLPDEFSQLTSLRNLDINGNYFEEIPEPIYRLENLETLFAAENDIKFIGKNIKMLRNLRVLCLGSRGIGLFYESSSGEATNQIKELPLEMLLINSLEELDLTGNPLPIPPEILEKTKEPHAIFSAYFGEIT